MKSIILSVLFFLSFTTFSQAQCIQKIDLESPHYLLGSPLHLDVNEMKDVKDNEVAYVKIEGQNIMIFDSLKELVHQYTLAFKNDNKHENDVLISYDIKELKGYTATIAYRQSDNCISCDVYMYDETGKLVFKVQADRLLESYYFQ